MSLDVAILCVLVLFALLGAASGAARQIANVVSLVAAYLVAGPAARQAAPWLAERFDGSELIATAAATLVVFLAVWIVGRLALAEGLERLIEGDDGQQRDVNRALGAVLGALKAAILVWVLLSAATFVERHVQVGKRRFALPARDSTALSLTRRYNLFDLAPKPRDADAAPRRFADDPAWQRLKADPRFEQALRDPRVRRAVETGDYEALVRIDAVKRLLKDPALAAQVEKLGRAAE